jgi:hypothetical protein
MDKEELLELAYIKVAQAAQLRPVATARIMLLELKTRRT